MAYGFPQHQQMQQLPQMGQQNVQPLFPQPQGNVYNINSTLEVANVPVGAGMSIALCLPENCMYIKTMQNGNPMFYPYKILPFTNEVQEVKEEVKEESNLEENLNKCLERIAALEKMLETKEKTNQTYQGGEW